MANFNLSHDLPEHRGRKKGIVTHHDIAFPPHRDEDINNFKIIENIMW